MIKRYIFLKILCALILTGAFAITIQAANSSVIHWGLHYEKPGEVPIGNATSEYLKTYNSYFYVSPEGNEKMLFLTFDAGYENGYTEKILDTLKENNIPAAFFLVGTYLQNNPELIKRMVDEGHVIGNHSMGHANMTKKSAEEFLAELKKFESVYESIIGFEMPKLYRPPEGIFNENNLIIASENGYETVLWSATYADWDNKNQPTKEQAFSKLLPRLHPGAILLLHSTGATNAEILHDFIAECRKMGYEFGSLADSFWNPRPW